MEVTLSEKQKQDNTNKKENIEVIDESTKSQAFFQDNSAMGKSRNLLR